jgi:hypothetical protein
MKHENTSAGELQWCHVAESCPIVRVSGGILHVGFVLSIKLFRCLLPPVHARARTHPNTTETLMLPSLLHENLDQARSSGIDLP